MSNMAVNQNLLQHLQKDISTGSSAMFSSMLIYSAKGVFSF